MWDFVVCLKFTEVAEESTNFILSIEESVVQVECCLILTCLFALFNLSRKMEAALSSETLLQFYPTLLDHHNNIRRRQIMMLFIV
jgi:hypothetical protein